MKFADSKVLYRGMTCCTKLAVVIALLLFCELRAAAPEGSLVGTWRHEDEGGFTVIQFYGTGKFEGEMRRNELGNIIFNGRWRLEKDKLVYEYASPWPGGVDVDLILKLDAAYYEIRAQDGSVRRYVRINADNGNPSQPKYGDAQRASK